MATPRSMQALSRKTTRQGDPFNPTTGKGTLFVDTLAPNTPPVEIDPNADQAGYASLLRDRAHNRYWDQLLTDPAHGQIMQSDPMAPYFEATSVLSENTGKSYRTVAPRGFGPSSPAVASDPNWWAPGGASSAADEARNEDAMPASLRRLYRSQFMGGR